MHVTISSRMGGESQQLAKEKEGSRQPIDHVNLKLTYF
jgi:hypothetical protein